MPEPTTTPVALRAQRELTIRTLCDHFAADRLEVAYFEQRLDVANRATTPAELVALTADLVPQPAAPSAAAAPVAAPAGGPVARPSLASRAHQLIVGIMGGATRRGRWAPAQESTAIGIMGGVLLDFREAQLPAGETVVHAYAFWGGVSIVVPPELGVTVNGVGIMGGFDHFGNQASHPAPDSPRLRIDGVAIMGGVDVQVRRPDEPGKDWHFGVTVGDGQGSERQARHEEQRTRREEMRQQARQLKEEWQRQRRQLKDEWRRK
ncbi:MAG TPA: LiaF domain-containing protein [Longimicrobiales bacterium]